jgi:hypothetical protein
MHDPATDLSGKATRQPLCKGWRKVYRPQAEHGMDLASRCGESSDRRLLARAHKAMDKVRWEKWRIGGGGYDPLPKAPSVWESQGRNGEQRPDRRSGVPSELCERGVDIGLDRVRRQFGSRRGFRLSEPCGVKPFVPCERDLPRLGTFPQAWTIFM